MGYKISKNAVCGVIGYGSWATALVHTMQRNGRKIWWHIRNAEVLESIKCEGRNTKYLNDVELDKDMIFATDDINQVVSNSDIILVAAPSAYLKNYFESLEVSLKDKFVISATKGIVPGDYKTVVEYIHDTFELPYSQTGLISGPSHAEEVSRDRQSYLTVVCKERENAELVGEMFASSTVHISYSDDIYGVEYSAILKNIYALAAGLASGLGYGDNFLAVLISASAKEMTRFLQETWPFERNTMDSAYLGDLLVTAYSSFSRNRRLGLMIGHGCTVKSALNEMTMIAEGYFAADCIRHITKSANVNMPIADMVYDVLYRNANPRSRMKELSRIL